MVALQNMYILKTKRVFSQRKNPFWLLRFISGWNHLSQIKNHHIKENYSIL